MDSVGNSLLSDCLQAETCEAKKDEINEIKCRLKGRLLQESAKIHSGVEPSAATKVVTQKCYFYSRCNLALQVAHTVFE